MEKFYSVYLDREITEDELKAIVGDSYNAVVKCLLEIGAIKNI